MISIIIPTFNAAFHIQRFVEVLSSQLHKFDNSSFFEIIVVDGGSSDNTPTMLERLLEKLGIRYKLIIAPPEASDVSSSRNLGIDVSSGYWITFADIDDIPILYALKKGADLGILYNCDIVIGNMATVDESFKLYKQVKFFKRTKVLEGMNLLKQMLEPSRGLDLRFQAMLFKSEFIKKWGIRFYSGAFSHEDFEFIVRALHQARRVCLVPYTFYIYKYSLKSIKCSRVLDGLKTLIRVYEFFLKNGEIKLAKDMELHVFGDLQTLLKIILIKRLCDYVDVDECVAWLAEGLESKLKHTFYSFVFQSLTHCLSKPTTMCIRKLPIQLTYVLLLAARIPSIFVKFMRYSKYGCKVFSILRH